MSEELIFTEAQEEELELFYVEIAEQMFDEDFEIQNILDKAPQFMKDLDAKGEISLLEEVENYIHDEKVIWEAFEKSGIREIMSNLHKNENDEEKIVAVHTAALDVLDGNIDSYINFKNAVGKIIDKDNDTLKNIFETLKSFQFE